MHPNPAFRGVDDEAALGLVEAIGFAHLFVATEEPMVAHVPITRIGHAVRFHVARANRITHHLDNSRALASLVGVEGYVSPSWYENGRDQVPTWNYEAVELEGILHQLEEDELTAQLDALAARHEPRAAPSQPWHRSKMDAESFARMLKGIAGFELRIDAIRATRKLSQNKSDADRAGVVAGLRASGNAALAAAIGT